MNAAAKSASNAAKAASAAAPDIRAPAAKPSPGLSALASFQQAAGNMAIQTALSGSGAQGKPAIGHRDDPYEQEADRIADNLVSLAPVTARGEEKSGPGGQPLPRSVRGFFEQGLETDLSQVRVHTGGHAAQAAQAIRARAFTAGRDVVFGAGEYAPESREGQRLLAHELVHVAQQSGGGSTPAVQRDDFISVGLIRELDEYTPPGGGIKYRVGDAAASSVLMKIVEDEDGDITFYWFNFARGEPQSGGYLQWDFRVGAATIGLNSKEFSVLGRKLTPDQWRALWPDPRAALLKMNEDRLVTMPDEAIVETYGGMIHTEAIRVLDENEQSVDALLGVPDRLQFYQEYAIGLREASYVRDVLQTRRGELEQSMAQMQGFSFGMAGRVVGMNPYQRLRRVQELDAVGRTLEFWYRSFPLLTRLQSGDIKATRIEEVLLTIKANIIATRAQLRVAPQGRAPFKLWDLDMVRARVDQKLGPRAKAVIAAEDKSRSRWAWVKAGAMLVGGIALLFVPGGAFIDLAIGIAMGVEAWDRAKAMGQAANTGIHVDDGLISQAAASATQFEAVVATILAVIGVAGMSLRVLRVGRLFVKVRQIAPAMDMASQVRVARVLADHPNLLRVGTDLSELNAALRKAGGGLRFEELQALRTVSYEAQGLKLPTQSRESLDEMLGNVWRDRRRLLQEAGESKARKQDPSDPIYGMYSGATEANPLTRPSADYLADVAGIAQRRPAGAVSNVQSSGEAITDLARAGKFAGKRIERTFHRFERAGADLTKVQERIYLNVKADRATKVMDAVVKDIVDNPAQFPGVAMAKLAGPGSVSGRAESIVIYAENAAAVERVMQRIRSYHKANPDDFLTSTPPMTNRVLEGVSVGSEPLASGGAVSFGQVRSRAIYDALRQSVQRSETQEQFVQRVLGALRKAGVDPDAPHLNLPGGGP